MCVFEQHNALAFCLTILAGNELDKLGIRLGRLNIAWDDLSFIELESFF